MREQIILLETELKKKIATNLKYFMRTKGLSQIKLSEMSGIPQSTISDILKEKFLASTDKIEKLADALNVSKNEIEPQYTKNENVQV